MSTIARGTACRMQHCMNCDELKPGTDFPSGRRYCLPCWDILHERQMAYRRDYLEKRRRAAGAKARPKTSNRLREETVQEYADHVFGFWPKLPLVKLALSEAPVEMQPAIKREVFEMARAA